VQDKKHASDDTDVNLEPETKDMNEDVSDNTVTNAINLNLGHEVFKAEDIFEKKEHICDKCSESFPLKAWLTLHIRKYHSFLAERGMPSSSVDCNLCDKKFSRSKNLKEHIRLVHEKEMQYHCRFCNQRFARKPTLNNHERTHTGVKPYQCGNCGKTCSRHIARKAGFKCETCQTALSKQQVDPPVKNENLPDTIKVEQTDMVQMTGTSLLNLYKQKYEDSQDRKDLLDLNDYETRLTSKTGLIEQNDGV